MYFSDSESEKDSAKKDDANSESDNDSVADSEKSRKREQKEKEKWEKKLYKPTGPDGQGWGDFRKLKPEDEVVLDDLVKMEKKEEQRREKLKIVEEMKDVDLKQAGVTEPKQSTAGLTED